MSKAAKGVQRKPIVPRDAGGAAAWPPAAGFDEIKSAQMAAYLAQKAERPIDKLKLIKLIYLSEREFLSRHLLPMTFDEFYSMKDGPVASAALNGLNGQLDKALWGAWIQNKSNKITSVKKRTREDFDNLSDADVEVLNDIWAKFGEYSTSGIWYYVHTQCPEYKEINKGRSPISYGDILSLFKRQDAERLEMNIKTLRREAAFI